MDSKETESNCGGPKSTEFIGVCMKKVEAIPVCKTCNCVMFKKKYQGAFGVLNGWGCPECHVTDWGEVDKYVSK